MPLCGQCLEYPGESVPSEFPSLVYYFRCVTPLGGRSVDEVRGRLGENFLFATSIGI